MIPAIAAMALQSMLGTSAARQGLQDVAKSYMAEDHPAADKYVIPAINAWWKGDQALFGPMDRAKAGGMRNDDIVAQMERVPVLKMARARLVGKHQGEWDAVRAIGGVVPLGGERYARYRDQLANR